MSLQISIFGHHFWIDYQVIDKIKLKNSDVDPWKGMKGSNLRFICTRKRCCKTACYSNRGYNCLGCLVWQSTNRYKFLFVLHCTCNKDKYSHSRSCMQFHSTLFKCKYHFRRYSNLHLVNYYTFAMAFYWCSG